MAGPLPLLLLGLACLAPALRAQDGPPPEFLEAQAECFVLQTTVAKAMIRHGEALKAQLTWVDFEALVRSGQLAATPEHPGGRPGEPPPFALSFRGGTGIICDRHGNPERPIWKKWEPATAKDPLQDRKLCWAQQAQIAAAIRLHDAAGGAPVTPLDMSSFDTLVKEGLLPRFPADPGDGPNSFSNYASLGLGHGLTCMFHGPDPAQGRGAWGSRWPTYPDDPQNVHRERTPVR